LIGEHERLALLLVLALAAVLRLANLESRGRFEFDQGQDMLVLRAFVLDGVLPLLGPKTSVGAFHHGALEYYLLAPAAWLSNAEPLGVTLEFALIGIAAVAATWWAGRVVHGPATGLLAGLLMAVSPAGVDESTFIWNPNPVPLFAALAIGCAWRARQTARAAWWALAVASAAAVANLHILGAVFAIPILGLLGLELVQARRDRDRTRWRAAVRGGVAGLAAGLLIYLPLIASELQSGFAEARAIGDYLASGGGETTMALPSRFAVTALRVVDWPFIGLITDVPMVASLVFAIVVGLLAWLVAGTRRARGNPGGPATRWLVLTLVWSIVVLTVVAPSLVAVVGVLPNDHYHSFADPLVVVGVAIAGVTLARRVLATDGWPGRVGGAVLAATLLGAVALALARQPAPDPNGGWPAARAAGERVVKVVGSSPGSVPTSVAVVNLPIFEPGTWISYPIVHAAGDAGARAVITADPAAAEVVVVGCDRAFESKIGATCGPAAEAAWLDQLVGGSEAGLVLVDRFDLGVRWSVSIYRRS
jgi:4-amino-4-deoxy-L-arabinose transferase-like glycosyltransferase